MSRVAVGLAVVVLGLVVGGLALGPWSGGTELTLAEVAGEVQVESAGTSGAVAAGTVLSPEDRVQTGSDGRATLRLGESTEIRVRPSSRIGVLEVDAEGVSLELEGGALRAHVRSGAVEVQSGGRAVRGEDATFEVGVREDVLQARAVAGPLAVRGVPGREGLEEGEQLTVSERFAEVGPIPSSLLLEVQWPEDQRTRAPASVVRGTTAPGASVEVRGPAGSGRTRADERGAFEVELPLAEGANPISVRVEDALGTSASSEGALPTRDTTPPRLQSRIVRPPAGAER